MNTTLSECLVPQAKSKIKAGNGLDKGSYCFFTSSPIQSKYLDEYQYDSEALIFGTGGNASVHYCNKPFSTSTDCLVMYGKEDINLKMIYYYLKGNIHLLQNGFKGAGLQHISKSYILNIPIRFPSYKEQAEIVKTFDMITVVESLLNRKLVWMDEIVKSRFVEMFGYDIKDCDESEQVKEIANVRVGIVIQPTQYYTSDEGTGVKAFRSANVRPFMINDNDWVYFDQESHSRMSKTHIHSNEVLIVRSGANLGQSCVVPDEYEGSNAIDILIVKVDEEKVLPVFFCAFVNFPMGRMQILDGQRGGAQKHLNVGVFEKARIPIPPIERQREFVSFVEIVDKSKLAVTKCLKKAEYLKSALMQKYFG